jgi:transcription initiation factor TFIIIB Brf1 subunit/transcription initiation factor TFIIB
MNSQNQQIVCGCLECGSDVLIQNPEGFLVCSVCGTEQDLDNFSYAVDFDDNNAPKNYSIKSYNSQTSVGSKIERQSPQAKKLGNIQNQYSRTYETSVLNLAYIEITGIISNLGLSRKFAQDCFKIFKRVWNQLPENTLNRSIDSLVPVVIYRTARMYEVSIDIKELFSIMKTTEKRFKAVLSATYQKFSKNGRFSEVLNQINKITDEMSMPTSIKSLALQLVQKNSVVFLSTTTAVAAASAVGMAGICLGYRKSYPLSKIGKQNGASSSAIKNRISKVLKKRGIESDGSIKSLDTILPLMYPKLVL